jgi:hypothetical protein
MLVRVASERAKIIPGDFERAAHAWYNPAARLVVPLLEAARPCRYAGLVALGVRRGSGLVDRERVAHPHRALSQFNSEGASGAELAIGRRPLERPGDSS